MGSRATWFRRAATGLALLLAGGSPLAGQTSQPTAYGTPRALCDLQDERITEASGIAASRRHPGCYYVHNDSGDAPRVFLIDRDGCTRLVINLKGVNAVDCEDISMAPGATAGQFDVCLADIGDNHAQRSRVAIYRFPEVGRGDGSETAVDVEPVTFHLRYADGPADAEAFCVHPRTGDGFILTKRLDGRSFVYKLAAPWSAKEELVLARVLTLELPPAAPVGRVVTAADIAPDGGRLAVRCYLDGWEWRLPPGTADRDFEKIFREPPARLSLPPEPQGEAICYTLDGQALRVVSEGRHATLYEVGAESPASRPAR